MLRVAVVGATGIVGQQFLVALVDHPWFRVKGLAASERSAGKTYLEALKGGDGALRWFCEEPPPQEFLEIEMLEAREIKPQDYDVIFTALDSDAAKELEPLYAESTPVISTAAAFRYDDDVPLLIPGVNDQHAQLIELQRERRGWRGFIAPIPNCTTTGLAVSLKPLQDTFGVRMVVMTSLQAVSGAGRSPGVLALDIFDNIIPYIPKEEEKVERESRKILGRLGVSGIEAAPIKVSCTCTRVPVRDAHTEAVTVSLARPATIDEVRDAFASFSLVLRESGLPSAPARMIVLHDDPYRPQPRLDRELEGGMATSIGRIRKDDALENGVKYVLVSHNTKMGAAKGAVLLAEMLYKKGLIAPV